VTCTRAGCPSMLVWQLGQQDRSHDLLPDISRARGGRALSAAPLCCWRAVDLNSIVVACRTMPLLQHGSPALQAGAGTTRCVICTSRSSGPLCGMLYNVIEQTFLCAGPCPACSMPLMLYKPEQPGVPYVACSGSPICRKVVYFPRATKQADKSPQHCTQCPGNPCKVGFR
jgi:hypothetical protein